MNMFNVCCGTLGSHGLGPGLAWALDADVDAEESNPESRRAASNFISLTLFATGIFIVMATFMSFTRFVCFSQHF